MDTGGLSTLDIILFVLAVPAVLILAIYGLMLLFRKRTQDAVVEISGQIQWLDEQLGELARFLRAYTRVDQEPYATPLDELEKEATELHTRVKAYVDTCRSFEEATRQTGPNRLQEMINAPYNWFVRWRRTGTLRKEGEEIASQLTTAEFHMRRIYELPLELAKQCRQAQSDVDELTRGAQDLQLKEAGGRSLDTVVRQLPMLQRGLDEIPAIFFETNQDVLLSANNLAPTVAVFEVLNRIRPPLARYLPQVREWNKLYEKAASDYSELKLAGTALRQAMAKPPAGLRIDALQDRLDQIAQMATDINKRLTQPDVDDLKPLSREISQLRRVIRDAEQQLTHASQQVNELSQVLDELHTGLEKLAAQFTELEHGEVFPLAWDASSGLLSDLRKRLQALGPAQQPRTPEEIAQHLKEVEAIRAGHKTHAEDFPKIAGQHRALVALLESAEIKEGSAWLRKSRDMLTQANIYDPRNWSKQDSIQTLPVELEELSQLHESLIPADRAKPIRETELSQRLKDTQELAAQHKRLRPRVESIQARLEKVRKLEEESKEKLTASYTALERVAILAENDDLLDQIATSEIDRLSEEIRQLGNELNARSQGEIDKKAQKIAAQAEKVNKALNGWLAQLNAAIAETGGQVNSLLIHLDGIAQLEENSVADARNLISRDDYVSAVNGSRGGAAARSAAGGRAAEGAAGQAGGLRGMAARVAERGALLQRQAPLNDLEVTAEIKRKNDLWLTLLTIQQALFEKTESLLAAYEETAKARNAAEEELAELTKRLPDRRAWPPSNQPPLTESQVLQPIDSRRDALKKQPRRVDAVILELGRLAQQYQHTAEHTRQVLDRVSQDEERVLDLEEQVDELKQRWQAQAQSDPNNLVMHEGVQQLMSQADSKLAYIKQQFMRGTISYEQVIRNLQLLYDELYSWRVPIDDQNDIGLNEKPNSNGKHSSKMR